MRGDEGKAQALCGGAKGMPVKLTDEARFWSDKFMKRRRA